MKSTSHIHQSNKNFFKRQTGGASLFIVIAITAAVIGSTLIYTKTAHADLFSFLGSIWGSLPASAMINQPTSTPNSQTVALLQAHASINPTTDLLADISPLNPDGDTLEPDILAAVATTSSEAINTQISTYTVQSGDTISAVAKMFGVTTNTILWANNLTGKSVLRAGQVLVILPISGVNHVVKKGDTIQGIVKKYKADLGDVLTYNDITAATPLTIGQTILIPNAEIQVSVPTRMVVGNNPAHDTNGPSYDGYYIRPIAGGRKTQGLHGYNAVDLANSVGTPIMASAAGTVIVARTGGWNGGYGNFVIISHPNGTQTLYAHAQAILVSVGQYVAQGQTIALLGSTGKSTGPHVHFEIRGAKNPF